MFFSVDDRTDGFDYDHNYSYDLSLTQNVHPMALATRDAQTKVANVFTAQGNEILKAVSVQTTAPKSHVHVDVYLLKQGDLADADPTDDGAPVASADCDLGTVGMHTIRLDKAVSLLKGQLFAIVERITSLGKDGATRSWLNLEGDTAPEAQKLNYDYMNQYASTVVANDGETYAYVKTASGYRWLTPRQITDSFSNKTLQFGNAYIKAYTVDDVRPTSGAPTWEPYAGGTVGSSAKNVQDGQLITDGASVYSLVATGDDLYSSKTYTLYKKDNDTWTKLGVLCEGAKEAAARLVGGTLYGAYLTGDVSPSTLSLAKWDAAAGAWQTIASKQTDSKTYAYYDKLSLGEVGGAPLMVLTKYQDRRNSIEVLKLEGTSLAAVGPDLVPAGFSNDSSSGSSSFRTVVSLPSSGAPALVVRFYTYDSKTETSAYDNVLCRYEGDAWTSITLEDNLSSLSHTATVDGTTYLLVMRNNGAPHLLVLKDGACTQDIPTTGLPQIRVRSMALAIGAGRLYCMAYEGDSELYSASLTPRAYVANLSDPGAFKSLGLDDEATASNWDFYDNTPRCTAQAALEGNKLVTLYGNRARALEAFPKVITAAANPDPTSLTNIPARRTDGTSKTAQASGESNLVLLVRFAGDTTGDWDEAAQAYTGLNAPYLAGARPEIRSEWERVVRLYDCVDDGYVKGTVRE